MIQQQLTPYQLRQLTNESIQHLNSIQRQVFNKSFDYVLPGVCINNLDQHATEAVIRSQRFFFCDPPGGTGKTFVTTVIQCFLETKGKHALAVASSAITAQLLDGGRTDHLALKILILVISESTCNIGADS